MHGFFNAKNSYNPSLNKLLYDFISDMIYIFLTPDIGNMGGAQMYVENKSAFLRSKGWKTEVFFYRKAEKIILPILSESRDNYFPDMAYGYNYVPGFQKKRILNQIKKRCREDKDMVIESQLVSLSLWGEAFARELGAKHITNFLEERFIPISIKEAEFLEYKLYHWQFLNAGEKRLKGLFRNYFKQDYLNYRNIVKYPCSNVVVESSKKDFNIEPADYTISSVGRLDKYYVLPMFDEIAIFAKDHIDKTINVIIIGGSPDGSVEVKIKEKYKNIHNIRLYFVGYLFPVPKDLLTKCDVGIASANSIDVTAGLGIPTISVDKNDSYAIGIYGYTTQNKFSRTDEPQTLISQLLEDILIKGYVKNKKVSITDTEAQEEFERQLSFLDKSTADYSYYPVETTMSWDKRIVAQLKWLLMSIKS